MSPASVQTQRPTPRHMGVALVFFAFGFAHLSAAFLWLVFQPDVLNGHYFRPQTVAFAHTVGLGFLLSLVVGSSYQLLPVALENKLAWPKLAKVHLALHASGAPLMIVGFARMERSLIAAGGTATGIGLLLYVINVGATALRPFRSTPTSVGILSAIGWLIGALLAASLMLSAKFGWAPAFDVFAVLGLHTYLVLGGFFLTVLIAVSYTLLPMFLLIGPPNRSRALTSLAACNAGYLLLWPTLFLDPRFALATAALLCLGSGLFLAEARAALRRKTRPLDTGLKLYTSGLCWFPVVAALGVVRATVLVRGLSHVSSKVELLVFVSAIFGVLLCTILGMAAKIVPFLVWQHRYAPVLGRMKVPKLSELTRPPFLRVVKMALPASSVVLCLGVALSNEGSIRFAGLVGLAGMFCFVFNLSRAGSHLLRPRVQALPGIPLHKSLAPAVPSP